MNEKSSGTPTFTHGTPSRTGVLLINLGTPEAPTPAAVRTYLKEFLTDTRVVEIPRAAWLPILHGFVLTTRPKASARRYATVWTKDGSPLKVHTERQTTLLRGYLGERVKAPLVVDYAMRYGSPSIAEKLRALQAQNCKRVLLVPMYPQYAASTAATAFDAAFAAWRGMRDQPAVRTIRSFHDDPGYIGALAQNIRDYWTAHGRPDQLLMSFHGAPRFTLERGDPYHCECQKSGRLLAEALQLTPQQYRITFQSRFGRTEWLKPYTADTLQALGKEKTRRVDVVCPGFVADCLETLEEIAIEGKMFFTKAGGGEYHYIPCLNERPDWIQALTDLVLKNLLGWTLASKPEELEASRLRARGLGAPS